MLSLALPCRKTSLTRISEAVRSKVKTLQGQNLAQAAADIQQFLSQLSQTYSTTTTSQKMTVVARAVDEIENNPIRFS
ncbi:hypothetical protein [Nostoc sphaeroides]|uniref:hypothetical protein n=1 Tax=Nostoc sphaeroides TaxID=446679 RepID=UPI00126A050E|nr:hypothetical protein [Nostoc sphaeroides]